ncbi:MAG TPA: nuclear transport factor 2 family protein [Amycolatopsis sp.]|uniref:nuclear transport factor 2 family protein n=1 Tax=Amycolatopsis sp. TaxID=37632 RepID=UPI002B4953B7|nr:nuclear transport factor 2 family protein [Amycolatopsis sp.]HKS45825.1 nuclear transport factor 2 family protein [Amycolatopsis sp.]
MTDHEEICRSWARAWETASPADFAARYAEDGKYVDHAFRGTKSGRDAIEEHSDIWHRAISNFTMVPREIHPLEDGAFMTFVGRGTFTGDLPILKATGKDIVFHGAVRITTDTAGKITGTEEYYSTTFAQAGGQESYALIGSRSWSRTACTAPRPWTTGSCWMARSGSRSTGARSGF